MIELYFICFRIPKMMSRLARERNQSAWKWSLIGIAAWIGAEVAVGFCLGLLYGLGMVMWGWPERQPTMFTLFLYVTSLAAAIGSVSLVRHVLTNRKEFSPPPPPTRF